ncbi:type VII secretion target [Nocardia sp. NPDC051990]|uniref:type VII secretion target n=1 Tax=Nocardia sp. NPDC051990 TaxID=3155285 RepID=UPI00342B5F20
MPETSMNIDPAVLRQLAHQHEQVGRDTLAWSEPPHAWLASFESTYGTIADPVRQALEKYYNARERAGKALAQEHFNTAKSLRDSADSYERTDHEMASHIRNVGQDSGGTHNGPPPSGVTPNTQHTPSLGGPVGGPGGPGGGPGGGPTSTDTPMAPAASNGSTPTSGAPGGPGGTSATPATSGMPGAVSHPDQTTGTSGVTAGTTPSSVSAGPLGSGPGVGPVYTGSMDDRGSGQPPAGPTAAGDATPMPVPMGTPFASAVAAAKDKEAEPAYVVGNAVNDDLVLARTLLSSVLAAVDSPVGMAWAVAVMRGPGGAGVFITSNEGRGWLPAKLYLPREVSTPWLWGEVLGPDTDTSSWESVSDPARVLVEFGLAWGPKANAGLSALVSSGPIDPGLRTQLSDVAMEGLVGPTYDVDLREFTPDTADRLGLVGSPTALQSVATVSDEQVRERCVQLATDAHTRVGRSVAASADAAGARQLRERILASLAAGQTVSRQIWDELRDADDLLAASMLSRRVDVGRVGLGDLRGDTENSALRDMIFERRCNELVLLLAEEAERQNLRDAIYAHEQVVAHPQFVEVPAAVSVAEDERVSRPAGAAVSTPAVGAPTVSAPVTAGPPTGAVVAPTSPPPVVAPDRH